MILTLPFPPSFNGYWRSPNKGALKGRTLISESGRKFRANALASVLEQLRRRPKAITANVAVSIVLYPPTNQKRDLDNYFKALLDALTHAGVYADDSQIKDLHAVWGPVIKNGKAEVTIKEISA
ncbi:RusA family crossover junction endodeoxyribonuclease [Serratia sp. M24T3]|uniref:RusA family crossover junction endodeoxyribonuclease n=1 Tax=Serratia sp. M24T3 TaxID=932213 RepID=UPI00025BB647|nr:RusA family crossover junction endodeoxyribonuclease [Serratia sp. M24T3]EIC83332.1 hypothetical protein SPM24T3_17015 [Serratia sp. M24T3]